MKKIIIIGIIGIILLTFSSVLIPSFGEYSDGERSGILQKFSKKGLIAKTYEGEIAMEGIKTSTAAEGSNVSSTFEFSVNDEEVAKQVEAAMGQKVKVYYKENIHTNSFDGSTDYFVYKIEILK